MGSRGCPRCNPPSKRRKRRHATASGMAQGWKGQGADDGLDLPDEDFDYDAYIAREFGTKPHKRVGIAWYWWVTAAVLLGVMVMALVR